MLKISTSYARWRVGIITSLTILILSTAFTMNSYSQDRAEGRVTGTVMDASTNNPLPFAAISLVGTNVGTVATADGTFELARAPVGSWQIQCTFVGYRTMTAEVQVALGEEATVEFSLAPDPFGLDEVVVTGVASRRSKAISEVAVSSVNVDDLVTKGKGNYNDLGSLIEGKVPGVSMYTVDGGIGAPLRFQMRSGGGLTGSGQPIIYIDGVRMRQDEFRGPDDERNQGGISTMLNIQPEDIASIEVLKGPAGAASYGTDGSNGVIIITTKRGRKHAGEGKSFNVAYKYTGGAMTQPRQYKEEDIRSYEYVNDYLKPGPLSRHNFNVSGGQQTFQYYVSYDKANDKGMVNRSSLDRNNVRANFDVTPNEKFHVGINVGYMFSEIENNDGGSWGHIKYNRVPFTRRGIDYYELNSEFIYSDHLTSSLSLEYKPIKNLSGRFVIGVNNLGMRGEQKQEVSEKYNRWGTRGVNSENSREFSYTGDIRYNFQFGNSTGSITAGAQLYDEVRKNLGGGSEQFVNPILMTIQAGEQQDGANEGTYQQKKAGIFGELSMAHNNIFYWSAMLRRDYVSVLKKGHESIYYPRVSGSVRLDRIMNMDPTMLGMLKLRSGFGQTGILPGRTAAIPELWGTTRTPYGVGANLRGVGNPDIVPERITEWEIGVEAEFLNHFSIDASYYYQWASNSIYRVTKLPSSGFNSRSGTSRYDKNIAAIKGQGIESIVSAFWSGSSIGGWSLNMSLLNSWFTNEVTDLGGQNPSGFAGRIIEGYAKGANVVEKPVSANLDEDGLFTEDFNYETVYMGETFAPYTGSFSLSFSAGGFTAYALSDWRVGAVFLNIWYFDASGPEDDGLGSNVYKVDVETEKLMIDDFGLGYYGTIQAGTPEYQAVADEFASTGPFDDFNTIQPTDFFRINQVALSYDLTKHMKGWGMSFIEGLTVGVSGSNLWNKYHKDFHGLEPTGIFGVNDAVPEMMQWHSLPTPRVITGFVRITL